MLLLLGQILLLAAVLVVPLWAFALFVGEGRVYPGWLVSGILFLGIAAWLPLFYGWW